MAWLRDLLDPPDGARENEARLHARLPVQHSDPGTARERPFHLDRESGVEPSGPLRLPGPPWMAVGAAIAIVAGQAMLVTHNAALFWLPFLLAAALPPLVALALAV